MPKQRTTLVLATALATFALAGSGGSKPTASTAPPAILDGAVHPVAFATVHAAVLALYDAHPAIVKFRSQDVEYTPATRDKVLAVCQVGGIKQSARAMESVRVLACAPLIFFFYSYGRHAPAPDSVELARKLYWYAVTANQRPYDAEPGLTGLLRRWGIH